MPKKSAAQQKKVDAAVRILETTTGVKVPQAMILAGFSKQDIANETIRRMILRRFKAKHMTLCRDVTIRDIEVAANVSSAISSLTGDDEHTTPTLTRQQRDAAPVKGRWVVIKCDSGPGRLNTTLLVYLRYHGFILYPGVPNTTAVTQETDQSY